MYTNFEILKIFNSASSLEDLEEIAAAFQWLIENRFVKRSVFLEIVSLEAFKRVT